MNILAVDDEELALEGLLDAIRQAAPEAEVHGFAYPEDALAFADSHPCAVAFLDVEMAELDGVELAGQLKTRNPNVNIIFATGFGQYRGAAFDLHASGYLTKPITVEKVRRELAELRRPLPEGKRIRVQTFGNFEVYLDGKPIVFKYSKTKELFAYLVDRRGALCTNGEIIAALFPDNENHDAYLRSLRKDLTDTLDASGCGAVLERQRGSLGVVPKQIDCDYYDWCAGRRGESLYRGEYMAQYSWGEFTNAMLAQASHHKN